MKLLLKEVVWTKNITECFSEMVNMSVCSRMYCNLLTHYLGVTEKPFKECFGNHTLDFKTPEIQNLTYQNMYGNSKMLIYHQLLNGVLLQKLCLSEKFYIIKSLNKHNLLSKKFELVNTCCHQSKLLLKRTNTLREVIQGTDILF